MPKIMLEHGALKAYCSVSQVTDVANRLQRTAGASHQDDCNTRNWGSRASGIVSFVEATHTMLGDNCSVPISDLRHGLNYVRSKVLQQSRLGHLQAEERKQALHLLQAMARLSVAYGELRHFSPGHTHGLAGHFEKLLAKLGVGSPMVDEGATDAEQGLSTCLDDSFSVASSVKEESSSGTYSDMMPDSLECWWADGHCDGGTQVSAGGVEDALADGSKGAEEGLGATASLPSISVVEQSSAAHVANIGSPSERSSWEDVMVDQEREQAQKQETTQSADASGTQSSGCENGTQCEDASKPHVVDSSVDVSVAGVPGSLRSFCSWVDSGVDKIRVGKLDAGFLSDIVASSLCPEDMKDNLLQKIRQAGEFAAGAGAEDEISRRMDVDVKHRRRKGKKR
jgi:hypothetical protein